MGVLIPIIALTIPALAVLFGGLTKVYKLRIEETRLRAGSAGDGAVEDLRAEVDQMRRELSEVHERLDFTERLLARGSERGAAGSAPPSPS